MWKCRMVKSGSVGDTEVLIAESPDYCLHEEQPSISDMVKAGLLVPDIRLGDVYTTRVDNRIWVFDMTDDGRLIWILDFVA